MRILVLGGTGEANRLATSLFERGLDAIYSYAGRTSLPAPQPLPVRIGGFGGANGLSEFLNVEAITHVIDATHPFATEISTNAYVACQNAGIELMTVRRDEWHPGPGDNWIRVAGLAQAAAALPPQRSRVFLAIGRQHIAAFAASPQHDYTLRFVDAASEDIPLPRANVVESRGPFILSSEIELLKAHRIEWIVTRNSGGDGARPKIDAARVLSIPVIMISRPDLPARQRSGDVRAALEWIDHEARLGA